MKWRSVHVFLHDNKEQDVFLLNIINNKIIKEFNSQIDCWFFIRYWEGGPHIRLRIKCKKNIWQEILSIIELWKETRDFPQLLNSQIFYKDHKFDGVAVNVETLSWHNNGEIEEIAYIPELDRYGGVENILYCEEIFSLSSEFTLNGLILSKQIKKDLALPVSMAFMDALLECSQFNRTDFFSSARHYWKVFSENLEINTELFIQNYRLSKKINISDNIMNELTTLLNLIKETITDNKTYLNILLSLSHMNYNRNFIIPSVEYELYKYMDQQREK